MPTAVLTSARLVRHANSGISGRLGKPNKRYWISSRYCLPLLLSDCVLADKKLFYLDRMLRKFIDQSQHRNDITMAARKESELSDADVLEALEELRRLGVLTDEEGER